MLDTGTRISDRYEVEAILGEGGLARVYRVRHLQLGGTFALKHLWMTRKGLQERLLREGRIQSQLDHPNVVRVLDVLDIDGQPGLLMEYVDGPSLQDILQRDGALPLGDALELFGQVLAGVAAAHAEGVLHRDLKPANILVARGSRGPVAKVADFGIAKVATGALGKGQTAAGIRMGTPGYMSPEQVTDAAQADQRADIFALGVLLYEMLTGRNPFRKVGDTGEEVEYHTLSNTVAGVYEPVDQVLDGCPEQISAVVVRALAVDPDARFGNCLELARALYQHDPDLLGRIEEAARGRGGIAAVLPSASPEGGRPTMVPAAHADVDTIAPSVAGGGANPTMTPAPEDTSPEDVPEVGGPPTWVADNAEEDGQSGTSVLGWVALLLLLGVVGAGAWVLWPGGTGPEVDVQSDVVASTEPVAEEAQAEDAQPVELPPAEAGDVTEAADPGAVEETEPGSDQDNGVTEPSEPSEPSEPDDDVTAVAAMEPASIDDAAATSGDDAAVAEPEAPEDVVDEAPEADDAVAMATDEPEQGAPEAAPEPVAQVPDLRGTWRGEANNLPLALDIRSQSGARFTGTATFTQGPTQRTVDVSGSIDPSSGAVRIAEAGGTELVFTGTATGATVAGTYTRRGQKKALAWSVTRR